jgi:hypothetical protein
MSLFVNLNLYKMAIKKNGRYSGKCGNTVRYMLNGREVERSIGLRVSPPTDSELISRNRMSAVNNLLRPVKRFVGMGYELQGKLNNTSPYSMAVSYHMLKENLIVDDVAQVDYNRVLFSKGDMPLNTETLVNLTKDGLVFTWDANVLRKGMKRNDTTMLLAYCPEKGSAFFEMSGARRTAGTDLLELTAYHQPVTLEIYISFVSADRKNISNSFHVGQVKF